MVNKELVRKRFEKSIETYAQNAVVQKQMAKNLVSNLIQLKGNDFDKILEIGCGAGLLTKNILEKLSFGEFFVNDITGAAKEKIKTLSQEIIFIQGDCETVELAQGMDLVISNSTFQWVSNLGPLLDKISHNLNKKGVIAFTTFGGENLHQIKAITGNSLNYYDQKDIENILNKNFEIIYSSSEIIHLEFDNANDILRHLKLSGVNALESKRWTKQDLRNFRGKYIENFKNTRGKLILTYHPMYFIALPKSTQNSA